MERISLLASVAALPPLIVAALLLVARSLAERYELACPSADAILTATGASKSRAYELAAQLVALVPTLARSAGRPAKSKTPPACDTTAITRAVLTYVMRHPGCVDRSVRQRYADGFRRFVLDLCVEHPDIDVEVMAAAVAIPLGTLKDWLRAPLSPPPPEATDDPEPASDEPAATASSEQPPNVGGLRIQSVLEAWKRWCGSFVDFCEHVRRDLRIHCGRDLIRRILETEGLRRPARRAGRSSDEIALRGSFRTYFPGAQWIGDGMQVPVVVGDRRFVFNVELDVDAHTAAFVGASVRDAEDSAAVIEALQGGVRTTGAPPISLLLDNRPSNHTNEVDEALGDTIRIRATPERPQNKAHVEGAFGLFSQALPPLVFDLAGTARDQARRLLGLAIDIWAKTTNHRPRPGRNGRSRVELYGDADPSDEEIANARRELRELAERQLRARRTLEARRRPDVLQLLDEEFARLALLDPERHIRIAIAGYPKSAIVSGLAIFAGKRRAGTLPDGVDARYLLGIVKNISAKTEGEILAESLYDYRVRMRDQFLASLRVQRDELCKQTDVACVVAECADRALNAADGTLERTFWLDTIVDVLREQPDAGRKALYLNVARRIEATFSIPPRERHDAVRSIADRLLKVE